MNVSFDSERLVHLLVLILLTVVAGELLVSWADWGRLSAYSLSCSVTCQLSNVIMGLPSNTNENKNKGMKKERRTTAVGSNPKKKKKNENNNNMTRLKES
mmetsp:Transcript_25074/g.28079  ORF Transcript_25074/g.28079 Transcript_25074/m.28079 type:complete len:100 (-) Transcript_25074:324-623(-)